MNRELIEFKKWGDGNIVSFNIVLDEADALTLMETWYKRVESCQAPLIETTKYGIHLHIPWTLKSEGK